MKLPSILFIGVGNMGNPMAANLIKAGYALSVHDLDSSKAKNLLALGAKWAADLEAEAKQADVLMTSLPGPLQVRGLMLGGEHQTGLLEHMREGAYVIDTSTSSPDLVVQLHAHALKKGVHFLEAPVTNAVDFAALGRLSLFVGGDAKAFEHCKPIFDVVGEKIFHVGQPGNGATVKLLTNLLWFVSAATIGEALMLGGKAGVPLETVWEAIKSSAGNSWVAEHDVPSIFAGHYDPSFSLALCVKDLTLINDIAKSQGYTLPMGEMAKSLFIQAAKTYGDSAAELHVVKLLEERVGFFLRPPNGLQVAQPTITSSKSSLSTDDQKPQGFSTAVRGDTSSPVLRQPGVMSQAHQHMPQGVAENYRYWGDERTVFVKNAKGCQITDVDGKTYVDFRLGYGPIILGYRDERVDNAVMKQIQEVGTLTGFATELDTQVVQQIKALCPQIDMVRFANSGTEAVMGAVRTARGYTKRDRIAIVEGGFHGLYDEMMWKSDIESWDPSGSTPPAIIPFGGGIPKRTNELVDIIGLNDFEALENLFKTRAESLACVVLEPIIGNAGSIAASPEWLQKLRDLCNQNGSLLIIDEVKSGFRVAKGGAQSLYGIYADLSTYAKAMGNGYPVAAFGGREDVMKVVGSHKGGVVHGGTYTANLVALSAAHATLDILSHTNALETAHRVGGEIQKVLSRVFQRAGIEHAFAGPDSMFGIHFTEKVPQTYRDWRKTNSDLYRKFAWSLIDHGLMLEPDSREPWFICEAHQHMDLSWLEDIGNRSMIKALNS
jgi:glutamate-1-semialdehyde 2,1-aminomutase